MITLMLAVVIFHLISFRDNFKMSVLKLLRPESKFLLDGLKCLSISGASKSLVNNHIQGTIQAV